MLGELAAAVLLATAAPQAPAAPEPPHVDAPAPAAPAALAAPAPVAKEPRHSPTWDEGVPAVKAQGVKAEPRPPALTPNALREELAAGARKRRDELAAIQAERARLEKLQAEIEAARTALRDETAQLEAKVKKGSQLPARAATPPADPSAGAEAVAKAMKGMKAEQAAAVLVRLDPPLAVAALRKMRPADVSAVLDRLKPETAAELLSLVAAGSQPARGGAR